MSAGRPRPPLFRALGASEPPADVVIDQQAFALEEIYKHDSWAATAIYRSAAGVRVVCKFNRVQSICLIPTRWLGNRLAARELRALHRLADLPAIPKPLGAVYAGGRRLRNAVARSFIPGHPLHRDEKVGPEFFSALRSTLNEMHRRGIAYVDLHKRENIIVGDDGKPYLVDFQIAFDSTHPRARHIPGCGSIFEAFRRADHYHLDKHIARAEGLDRPHLATMPTWLRFHRLVAVPFRECRRRLLVACGIRTGRGSVASEAFAEDAVRRDNSRQAA